MNYKFAKSRRGGALIVSPYLDHLGGGERYMLSVAQVLEKLGYTIYFAWDNLQDITNLSHMLGITLTKPELDPVVKGLYTSRNPLNMFMATRPYDVVVYLSDGSIPLLGGKKNILHMQVPFHDVEGRSIKNQLKKMCIHSVIVNSQFTKRIVDREYGINSRVVYPPVHIETKHVAKEHIILSVGRFEPSLNAKKQDVLIDAFKRLTKQLPGWKLVLAGGSANDAWVDSLKKRAGQAPVEFAINASYEKLSRLYAQSALYWHAAGFGVDENRNPELVEHFGITTAEAIGNGCIPLVVPYGGQREIVTDLALHWESIEELCEKTLAIAKGSVGMGEGGMNIDRYSEHEFAKSIEASIQ